MSNPPRIKDRNLFLTLARGEYLGHFCRSAARAHATKARRQGWHAVLRILGRAHVVESAHVRRAGEPKEPHELDDEAGRVIESYKHVVTK